jgi:hypothetical protein
MLFHISLLGRFSGVLVMKTKRGLVGIIVLAILFTVPLVYAADVTVNVDASSYIRTIPMTLYGGNLASWDGSMAGGDTTFNNLAKASGCKYFRVPGGSWGNGVLWSDIEGPNGSQGWKVSYNEYLNLMSLISQPGEEVHPTLQPIVNFPGWWYDHCQDNNPTDDVCDWAQAHVSAVNAAVGWVTDQTARAVCAKYWEIGNEIGGPWEVGYFPQISGTYYGDYFADFSLAMKAVNPNIKIGAVAEPTNDLQPWGWYQGHWDHDTLLAAQAKGVVPDFFIIHSYQNGGGDGNAPNNPNLLGSQVDQIAQWTSNLDTIVQYTLGSQYVGQIEYCMTEWNTSGTGTYDRPSCYVNAMFRAQYILEMAKHKWTVSNPWIYDYGSNYSAYPVWYIKPLLIYYFGQDMVTASSSNSLVRAYAAKDTGGNLTIFIVNNSPTSAFTTQINIAGMTAGQGGQKWTIEPAGNLISGGLTIQDKGDISINGTVHPNPLTVNSITPQSFTSSGSFTVTIPASAMILLKVPQVGGNILPNVEITSPLEGDVFTSGEDIVIEANASDVNGYITKVEFFEGSTKLGEDTNFPYSYTWNDVNVGRYSLFARATDNNNATTTSPVVDINVFSGDATGFILREWWTGVSGTAVSNLTSDINYPTNPNGRALITSFEGPTNWADNYGTRFRGYVYPPATGNYTFWIASDDAGQLKLSTDDNPANAVQIAYVANWTDSRQWTKESNQQSAIKSLVAGKKYYIEALQKENGGGDNIAVAWQGPGITQQVIDGAYLSPWLYNFNDYATFAPQWLKTNCSRSNAWCSGADRDRDGSVQIDDLMAFAQWWLYDGE